MRIHYEKATPTHPHPRYFMYSHSQDEMRFLTILRDLLSGKPNAHLVFIGAEPYGQQLPGMPKDPVQSVSLSVVDSDSPIVGSPAAIEASLDPTIPVPQTPLPAKPSKAPQKVFRASRGDGTIVNLNQ